ncbi:CvpA family protein [Pseudooceanicola sp. CBS1P-1]|uniref:CvpA family protein n=1 Tax=Pseudooceanicola albus TaxID=2692189 RepID=A0A6L7FZ58_9RHOB|nr:MULTISPECIES: CvpA family protein [Pseudooceanicola]MBT9382494.1 CvpA family protein [Pseudooceanicola endophyticus]MXN17035.1 CvpA family protein [Pseudooceanicola albus]
MEGFTIIDAIVAAVIFLSAILAYSRGFLREVLAIVGWVAAAIVAFAFAPEVVPLVKEIPVLGDFLSDSCELSVIASFGILFAVVLAIVSLFVPLFSSAVQRSVVGGLDQAAGFVFGIARGILLVAIGFFVYNTVLPAQDIALVEQSRSAVVFANLTQKIQAENPERALGWVTSQYETLTGYCSAPAGTPS